LGYGTSGHRRIVSEVLRHELDEFIHHVGLENQIELGVGFGKNCPEGKLALECYEIGQECLMVGLVKQ